MMSARRRDAHSSRCVRPKPSFKGTRRVPSLAVRFGIDPHRLARVLQWVEADIRGDASLARLNDPQALLWAQAGLEIGRIELGAFHQSIPLGYANNALVPLDETVSPEALERAIDVNRGHRRRFGKLRLGYGQVEDEVPAVPCGVKAGRHLAQQVCNPRLGVPATDVDNPFRQDRRIHHAVPPKGFGDGWITSGCPSDCRVRDAHNGGD